MKTEEAIKTIEIAIAEVEWDYPMNYAVAFEMAIAALRAQQEAEKNEPLTPDELLEMGSNSQPVWDSRLNMWCVVRPLDAEWVPYIGGGNRLLESGRFYRHKPKEVPEC